jgi:hypothetical protein
MKASPLVRASSLVVLTYLAGCGESGEKAAGIVEAASKQASAAGYDLSKLTPEAAKSEVTKLVNNALAKLGSVRDAATAENISKELAPLLDQLGELKTVIGDELDLSSLQKTVTDLIAKFKEDPRVQSALQPLLDKISNLTK